MKIALVQMDCELGNVASNCETISRLAGDAASDGCELAVFPEMCDSGYEMATILRTASCWPAGAFSLVREAARQHRIGIVAGLAERTNEGVYNTLVAFDSQGELLAKYRKIHLFSGSPVFEHRSLLAGSELAAFEYRGATLGLMTCYDLRFPELARALTLRGAEMIVLPAAWPEARISHWKALAQARAIENQLYVCAVNRSGIDSGLRFGGCTQLVDPLGKTIEAAADQSTLCGMVDLEFLAHSRRAMPVLKDRRLGLAAPAGE